MGWTVTGRASERSVLDGEHVVNHVRVSDKTSAVADLHTQKSSETTQWCHAAEPPGPADIFSRGGPGTDLAPGGPWIRGPAARSGPAALSDDETRVTACVTERAEPVVNSSDFSSCLMDSGGLLRVGGRRWKRKNTQPQDRSWRRRRRECLPAHADRTLHVDHGHDRGQGWRTSATDRRKRTTWTLVGEMSGVCDPGVGGLIPAVDVTTDTGQYRRPVSRLCRLSATATDSKWTRRDNVRARGTVKVTRLRPHCAADEQCGDRSVY